jgi:hypothetical protein
MKAKPIPTMTWPFPAIPSSKLLQRRGNYMGYSALLKSFLQVLEYERTIPQDHTSHDRHLLGPQAVAERHVCVAVHPPNPPEVLIHRPDAPVASTIADILFVDTYRA